MVSLFAAAEMMAKHKLAMAVSYCKIADEMTARSAEIPATLKPGPLRYDGRRTDSRAQLLKQQHD